METISKTRIRELCEAVGMEHLVGGKVVSKRLCKEGFPIKHVPMRLEINWNLVIEIAVCAEKREIELFDGSAGSAFLWLEKEIFWQPII